MRLKITSQHKVAGNITVSNFFISISEFYLNTNTNTVQLRTDIFNEIEESEEGQVKIVHYPLQLLHTDPLYQCLNQDRTIIEWATDQEVIELSGTRYLLQATLLFEVILNKISEINNTSPNTITYETIGF
jgi:hypothetical protein